MREVTIRPFIVPVVLFSISLAMVWAGCVSDCKDDYDSAVQSCRSTYDDPDDADVLQQCLQNAKYEYESCIEECNS